MPPVKTAFSLRFGPKPSSSQGVEPGRDRPEPSASSQTDKRRKKKLRSKTGAEKIRTPPRLKVQLFERNKVTKENKTPTKWTLELATRQNKTNINQGGQTQSVNPALIDGDVFFFSELSNTPPTKEKAKHSVLRTISRMLEENCLIRNRLATLSQAE